MAKWDGKKRCSRCGEQKDLDDFYKRKDRGDGYSNLCKECTTYERDRKAVQKAIELDMREMIARQKDRPETRVCEECGNALLTSEYDRDYTTASGYNKRCRYCVEKTRKTRRYYKRRK